MHNYKLLSVFNKYICFVFATFFVASVSAVVNVETTRVVFNENDETVSLSLNNSEKQPTIVQLWTDDGDPFVTPEKAHSSIVIVPPIFKMEPNEIRSLRLIRVPDPTLAKDRESLFWLNIYQIPPNTENRVQNEKKVVLPLRIRMKVFVRPTGISALQEQHGQQLTFSGTTKQGNPYLDIENPTPWYMTLTGITLDATEIEDMMIAPKSTLTISLDKQKMKQFPLAIQYQLVNDTGNYWSYEKPIILK